jgi:hypothetical protein
VGGPTPLIQGSSHPDGEVVSVTDMWKVRIAALWLAVAVCQVAGVILVLFEPGVLRDLMAGKIAGEDSAAMHIALALGVVGILSLAFLTLVLEDRGNRWMNGVCAVGSLIYPVSSLAGPLVGRTLSISSCS